mgnify:CR=1 FL=1
MQTSCKQQAEITDIVPILSLVIHYKSPVLDDHFVAKFIAGIVIIGFFTFLCVVLVRPDTLRITPIWVR